MTLIVDPSATVEFESDGVKYKVRGMTSREKMAILPHITDGGVPHDVALELLSKNIIGWDSTDVEFNPNELMGNLDHIPFDSLVEILNKVLSLSGLKDGERKN